MKKTVAEWLMYMKLTQKKVNKLEEEIFTNAFIVTTNGDYEKNKVVVDKKVEDIKSKYDKLSKLKSNINKVKEQIMKFNASTTIKIGDETLLLAYALEKWNKRYDENSRIEKLHNVYLKLEREKKKFDDNYNEEQSDWLEKMISNGNRALNEKEKDIILSRVEDFKPVTLDPLNLKELYDKVSEENDLFLEQVNVHINICNSTNDLEIKIED